MATCVALYSRLKRVAAAMSDHRIASRRSSESAPAPRAIISSKPAQANRDLGKLLEQLPERQRLPIVHVKLEGLSVTETALITGLSESAVKIGVHRGLKASPALRWINVLGHRC